MDIEPKVSTVARTNLLHHPVAFEQKEGLSDQESFSGIHERALMRKIDFRVIPVLCLIYFISFLDRVNIASASLYGLQQDLHLTGNEYNTAILIFFVPLILFEIPSNLLLKYFKPHVWFTICVFFFGLISLFQGFTQNFAGILVARFFLGVFENGMFPGCVYMMAMWYKRSEAQKRYTFLISSATLANGFGGLLAFAIGNLDGVRGYSGWRWIFFLEGTFTCVLAAVVFFLVADFPEEVTWLSAEEKEFVTARLYADIGDSRMDDKITVAKVLAVFKDHKLIIGSFIYFPVIVPAYSYSYFSPSIIQGLGFDTAQTLLLSIPPWICAFVFSITIASLSDRYQHRFGFCIGSIALSLVGFIILLIVHDHTKLQYAALYVAATGLYTTLAIVICWYSTNVGGHIRRLVVSGWQGGLANSGGFIAAYSFLSKDALRYIAGYSICVAFMLLAALTCTAYYVVLTLENRRRDRSEPSSLTDSEKRRMGDLDPDYRYIC